MRIALASSPVIDRNMEYNVRSILETIGAVASQTDLLLFGEAVLQGFDSLCWVYEQDCHMAVTQNDPVIGKIRAAAREAGVAVSFGYLEKSGEVLYSSQLVVDEYGEIIHNFRRVSPGWKEPVADEHYREGQSFQAFTYKDKRLAIGLCGDLWTPGRPEEMKALHIDAVLWPVWCDYDPERWNSVIKYEYAEQAGLCGRDVLLVNPVCRNPGSSGVAAGGTVHFRDGRIAKELPSGGEGILLVEI